MLTEKFKATWSTALHKLTILEFHSSLIKEGLDVLRLFGSFVVIPTLLHGLSKSLQQPT